MKKNDLSGKRFGRLVVLDSKSVFVNDRKRIFWRCICDCGKIKEIKPDHLTDGKIKSCGCLRDETTRKRSLTHGETVGRRRSREYGSWLGAKNRCYSPKSPRFKSYGDRGIRMCERWEKSFSNFLKDMGRCPKGLSLDRIDVDGNYSPENCHWANADIQSRHRTDNVFLTLNGVTKIEADWARELNIDKRTFNGWLKKGLTIEEISKRTGYA